MLEKAGSSCFSKLLSLFKARFEAAFTSSLYAGSLGGILLGCLLVVLASLPLCFSRLKKHRQAISALTISLGLVTLLVPLRLAFESYTSCVTWFSVATGTALDMESKEKRA